MSADQPAAVRYSGILFNAAVNAGIEQPVFELRALGVGERGDVLFGYFDDASKLADAAANVAGAEGVYVTLNPVNPALLGRSANRVKRAARKGGSASDGDILRRLWLLVDLDAKRPAGISATDTEHSAAHARADEICAHLVAAGWPAPVDADSGNGAHLLFRIDLPNDDEARDLIKRVLEALNARFTDAAVKIDISVFNAARISKVYGTIAAKGDSLPDRPHRRAKLLNVPAALGVVTREQLETLAAGAPKDRNHSPYPGATGRARCGVLGPGGESRWERREIWNG